MSWTIRVCVIGGIVVAWGLLIFALWSVGRWWAAFYIGGSLGFALGYVLRALMERPAFREQGEP